MNLKTEASLSGRVYFSHKVGLLGEVSGLWGQLLCRPRAINRVSFSFRVPKMYKTFFFASTSLDGQSGRTVNYTSFTLSNVNNDRSTVRGANWLSAEF